MKKLKPILTIILIFSAFLIPAYKNLITPRPIERTEFLFDTKCSITVFSKRDSDAALSAFNEAARIHNLSNFFSDESDVSRINNAKKDEQTAVDDDIIRMLDLAQEVFYNSGGAFDITIAPVSILWKFSEANPHPPTSEVLSSSLRHVNGDYIKLNKESSSVIKTHDDVKIDLGGIAKGYAADKVLSVLSNQGVKSAIIDFGGNILTLGKNPRTKDGKWRIGLQKPFSPTGEYFKILEVGQTSVATSGSYQRFFRYNNKLYHHIIDPKTGMPANQEFSSVAVITKNSALADCLATAIFVLGESDGKELAKKYGAELEFYK